MAKGHHDPSDDFKSVTSPSPHSDQLDGVSIDFDRIKAACTLDSKYWSQVHAPGKVSV